ncbi:hypothetical protein [Chryseobacterium herbae]|uniref:DUF4377 domain-containing protein n=1 Tax=Chryseobacterium herbae TaxID=2976476 RepID=A0ABT2ISM3_9FLAO|nr:hypothetical protein [Chryseobacterium sp. pc1-10]MCT2561831.1 hypothetical protein [Chryseobacterium sp. pc1-10]
MTSHRFAAFAILVSVFFSCKNKEPFVPDHEIGTGIIIGMENCKNDPSKNAWLISFTGPNAFNRTYGDAIVYEGANFTHVVKAFSLPDSAKVPGKKYSLEFYPEERVPGVACDASDPISFNLTKIRIRNLVRSAN